MIARSSTTGAMGQGSTFAQSDLRMALASVTTRLRAISRAPISLDVIWQQAVSFSNSDVALRGLYGNSPATASDDSNISNAAKATRYSVQADNQQPTNAIKSQARTGTSRDPTQAETNNGPTWFLMDPQARQKTTSPTLRAPQACQEIDCLSMKEEIFGTIVIADTSKREGEVLALADDTESSLYASVPTKSIDRAIRFAKVTGR
ncbi:aldehyde dehydrogenase [Diplocarpon mali]|nr:aldehyde dehydrogenase [Diplocarpon mali]